MTSLVIGSLASPRRRSFSAAAALLAGTLLVAASPAFGASSGSVVFSPKGGASATGVGDYVGATAGLHTFYRYFIEVPSGASKLVVDLFDSDVGAGGFPADAWDFPHTGDNSFDTTCTYTLLDPSGASRPLRYALGNNALPTGGNNAWLSLYDSSAVVTTAPAFGSVNSATANAAVLTITKPTGTAANDLLIAIIGDSTLGDTVTAPAGWTAIDQTNCGAGCRLAVFFRVAGGAEGANYTFTLNAAASVAGTILRYTGVDTTNPINASLFANGGSNNTVVTPTVETLRENTRVLRLFASSANDTSTWAASTARANANRANISVGGADATQTNGGLTGTENDTLSGAANWRGGTIAIKGANSNVAPANGHWEGRVDCSGAANGVADSGYGIRAHDGDTTAGGTEYPIYYESFQNYISNPTAVATLQAYVNYPYVTASCTAKSNNFDWDHSGATAGGDLLRLTSRSAAFVHNATGALLSESDTWVTDSFGGWTTDANSSDYGIWKLEVTIGNFPGNGNNHITYYIGNSSSANAPPTAQPEANTYRVYLPTDGGAAPVKPYLEQQLRYSGSGGNNGPNPPVNGSDSVFTVTVRVVNPTANAITFSATNLVTANVPTVNVRYDGIAQVSQGTVIAAPAINGTGNVTWNPGTVAAGATAILAYRVIVHPTAAGQRVVAVGTPASGNGTRATWLDETGNATQARATFTFGPLCELAATEAMVTPAVVAGLRAVAGPNGPAVEWSTAAEIGSAGFDVYRLAARRDGRGDRWQKVNQRRVAPLVGAPQGGTYRIADPGAPRTGALRYVVVETAIDGSVRQHGLFDVAMERLEAGEDLPAGPHVDAAWAERIAAARSSQAAAAVSGRALAKQVALKIGVGASGLYRIDAAALAGALGATEKEVRNKIQGGAFALTQQGQPVAWIADAGGQAILFWGQAIDSIYSAENVYWLRSGDGLAMGPASGGNPGAPAGPGRTFTDTAVAEKDAFAAVVVPADPDSDYWYWDFAIAGDPANGAKSFPLDAPGFSSGSAQLAVGLHGASSAVHRAQVALNGVALGETQWSGLTAQQATFAVPPGVLQASGNQVQVSADPQAAGSIFYIDRFDTTYERSFVAQGDALAFHGDGHGVVTVSGFSGPQVRVLDLTDRRRPKSVTGLRVDTSPTASVTLLPALPTTPYVAVGPAAVRAPLWMRPAGTAKLRSAANGADYLVVTTADLKAAAQGLADLRAAQGLRTAVVDVADVMDEWNDGIPSPHALHDFLAYAHASWRPAPRYVVLAGGGNFDYRNLEGTGGNLVPPLMVVTPWGLFASDNRLADGDGDGLPDVAIGRLPVVSAAELGAVVRKLRAYEAAPGAGWAGRLLALADGTDGATDFAADSVRLAQQLPPAWSTQSISLDASGLAAARSDLFTALGAGVDLVTYLGHGGLDRLAAPGLLVTGDVAGLANAPRLPVVAALTCSVNRFEVPGFSSLGEELVRQPGGGVAAWSASGLSYHAEGRALGTAFLHELAKPTNPRLGDAVLAALRDEANGGVAATLDLYTLLGDPATIVKPLP